MQVGGERRVGRSRRVCRYMYLSVVGGGGID